MKIRTLSHILILLLSIASTSSILQAGTISVVRDQSGTASPPLTESQIPSPSLGEHGYILYATEPNPGYTQGYNRPNVTALPSYVSVVESSQTRYLHANDTDLQVAGAPHKSGFLINSTVTLTFGTGAPSVVQIALLVGNSTDNAQGNITLTSPTSSFPTTVLQYNDPATPANEWVVIALSGIVPGNQLAFSVGRGLGGIAFDPVTTAGPTFPSADVPAGLGVNAALHAVTLNTQDLQQMQNAGIRYVRVDLTWNQVEQSAGVYVWTTYDTLVANLSQYGIKPVFMVAYQNSLYTNGDTYTMNSPVEWNGYANFAAAAVARYDEPGVLWEIWNEPNTEQFWKSPTAGNNLTSATERAIAYMGMIDAAVPAMRAASANVTIISGGVLDIGWAMTQHWLSECFTRGLLDKVDGLGIHTYGAAGESQFAERVIDEMAYLREMLATHGAPADYPIFQTEYGTVATNFPGTTAQQQDAWAATCVKMYMVTLLEDLYLNIWYQWRSGSSGYALLNGNGTPRTAYTALSAAVDQLEGYVFEKRLNTVSPYDYALVFRSGNLRKLVLWSPGNSHNLTINVSSGSLFPTAEMYGATGNVTVSNNQFTIGIDPLPRYVALGTAVPEDAPPSVNVALNQPATASSQTHSGRAPAFAFDGDAQTRWASIYADNQWIQVDLGQVYIVNRVVLDWHGNYASAYRIEASLNGTSWSTLFETTEGAGGVEDIIGLAGSGRYLRVTCVTRGTPYANSLNEVGVYSNQ